MSNDARARHQSLLAAVEGLYGRLQSGTLSEGDVIDLHEITPPDLDDFVARLLADPVEFAAHFEVFMRPFDMFRTFTKGEIVLDVGAHWGYSALAMRHQGCGARIVSIDAMPFNIPPLARLKGIEGSDFDFIHVAASDRPGRLTLYTPVLNRCAASGLCSAGRTLTPRCANELASRAQHFPPPQNGDVDEVRLAIHEVAAQPIDSLVDALRGTRQRIVGVKMDLEGHEAAALAGASRLFSTERPLLMVEGGNRSQPVVDVMRSFAYVYAARVEGRIVAFDGHPRATDGFWVHPDQMARYRERGIAN